MSSLPNEIYIDILSRVPSVKSLLRCKCVCKNWYNLISDHRFAKMHLNNLTKNNYIYTSLILKNSKDESVYFMSYDSLLSNSAAVVGLETPYKYLRDEACRFWGSCHGLVYGWNDTRKHFILWNPVTKESRALPKSDSHFKLMSGYHGLGYDYKTDDYLLVCIYHRKEDKASSFFQVYSLKSNSWKSCQSIQFPFGFRYQGLSGVFLNGALHWFVLMHIGGDETEDAFIALLSMDISEERFEQLQLPPKTTGTFFTSMEVLERCLCVLARTDKTLQIWVMQDYGVPKSWTKLYTIELKSLIRSYRQFGGFVTLLGSLRSGEVLFSGSNENHIILYDPKYGTAKKFKISGLGMDNSVSYFESLVSPSSTAATRKKWEITTNLNKSKTATKRKRNMSEHTGGREST